MKTKSIAIATIAIILSSCSLPIKVVTPRGSVDYSAKGVVVEIPEQSGK